MFFEFFCLIERFSRRKLIFLIILILGFALFLIPARYQVTGVVKSSFQEGFEPVGLKETEFLKPHPYRVLKEVLPPSVSAKAAIVFDRGSGQILFEKNSKLSLPPASLTKIATAVLALEELSLKEEIIVSNLNFSGTQMGLKSGDCVSVENLLYGLLLNSGNDAAYALETALGGSEAFVSKMKDLLSRLNLRNTHFSGPSGLERNNHISTASDLAQLSDFALRRDIFAKVVQTKEIKIVSCDKKRWYSLENTNKLLWEFSQVKGIKTGWNEEAGENLIVLLKEDKSEFIIVVLGSEDRFQDGKVLIEWIPLVLTTHQ